MIKFKVRDCTKRQHACCNTAFKASVGSCVRDHEKSRAYVAALNNTCTVSFVEYADKFISFQCHLINLRKQHNYLLGQISNADQMPIYFGILSNV